MKQLRVTTDHHLTGLTYAQLYHVGIVGVGDKNAKNQEWNKTGKTVAALLRPRLGSHNLPINKQ